MFRTDMGFNIGAEFTMSFGLEVFAGAPMNAVFRSHYYIGEN